MTNRKFSKVHELVGKIHSPFLEMYLNIKGKNKNKKKIQAKQDKKENKKKKPWSDSIN